MTQQATGIEEDGAEHRCTGLVCYSCRHSPCWYWDPAFIHFL